MGKDFHGGMTAMGVHKAPEDVKKNIASFWESVEKEKQEKKLCEANIMKKQEK